MIISKTGKNSYNNELNIRVTMEIERLKNQLGHLQVVQIDQMVSGTMWILFFFILFIFL